MLGLTIPDAIAFGSLCAALLAAFAGTVRGERQRPQRESPPRRPSRASERSEAMRDLAEAIEALTAAIRDASIAETSRDQYTDLVDTIIRRLDDRGHNNLR